MLINRLLFVFKWQTSVLSTGCLTSKRKVLSPLVGQSYEDLQEGPDRQAAVTLEEDLEDNNWNVKGDEDEIDYDDNELDMEEDEEDEDDLFDFYDYYRHYIPNI